LFGSVGFDWITYIQATLKYAELMDRATAKDNQDTLLADQVGLVEVYGVFGKCWAGFILMSCISASLK
jgi:hypothetical protein